MDVQILGRPISERRKGGRFGRDEGGSDVVDGPVLIVEGELDGWLWVNGRGWTD